MKHIIAAASVLALSACSSTDELAGSDNATAKNDNGYECKMVRRTGSNLPEKVCTTKKQRDEQAKKSKEWMEDRRAHGLAGDHNRRGDGGGVK